MESKTADADVLRNSVAEGGQVLSAFGAAQFLGHVSARLADGRIVIKPRHSKTVRGMRGLRGSDMIVVDTEGNLCEGSDEPPSEVHIHTEIYRARSDVRSVVHTHQRSSVLIGVVNRELYPVLHSHVMRVGDVSMYDSPLLVTSKKRGAALASALGRNELCHLRGHGIVSVGLSVPEAVTRAILMEELADATLRILSTGIEPHVITDEDIAELRRSERGVDGRWAYYQEVVNAQ